MWGCLSFLDRPYFAYSFEIRRQLPDKKRQSPFKGSFTYYRQAELLDLHWWPCFLLEPGFFKSSPWSWVPQLLLLAQTLWSLQSFHSWGREATSLSFFWGQDLQALLTKPKPSLSPLPHFAPNLGPVCYASHCQYWVCVILLFSSRVTLGRLLTLFLHLSNGEYCKDRREHRGSRMPTQQAVWVRAFSWERTLTVFLQVRHITAAWRDGLSFSFNLSF